MKSHPRTKIHPFTFLMSEAKTRVQIYQEQLDRFLEVAQRLELEGLTGNDDHKERKMNETLEEDVVQIDNDLFTETGIFKKENEVRKPRKVYQPEAQPIIVNANNSSVTNTEEIDEKIGEYVIRGEDGIYSYGYCGKVGMRDRANAKKHVEIHIEGLSYPCHSCDKTFRSRHALSCHKSKYHRL